MLFVLVLGVKWGATCCGLFLLLTCTFFRWIKMLHTRFTESYIRAKLLTVTNGSHCRQCLFIDECTYWKRQCVRAKFTNGLLLWRPPRVGVTLVSCTNGDIFLAMIGPKLVLWVLR